VDGAIDIAHAEGNNHFALMDRLVQLGGKGHGLHQKSNAQTGGYRSNKAVGELNVSSGMLKSSSLGRIGKITVSGKHGKLEKDLSHIGCDLRVDADAKKIVATMWFTKGKQKASLRTCLSHVKNMMVGVTTKYQKSLRLVYAHFPINFTITENGKGCEIRNFLGEKNVRRIKMLGDCVVSKSADVKDEIFIEGTNIDFVGRSAALISQSALAKNKDIRKFLDGIYVSASGEKDNMSLK